MDISKGLNFHQAENLLSQLEDALNRIDQLQKQIIKIETNKDCVVSNLQKQINELQEQEDKSHRQIKEVQDELKRQIETLTGSHSLEINELIKEHENQIENLQTQNINLTQELDKYIKACGGTEEGKKLLKQKALNELQIQKQKLEEKIKELSNG